MARGSQHTYRTWTRRLVADYGTDPGVDHRRRPHRPHRLARPRRTRRRRATPRRAFRRGERGRRLPAPVDLPRREGLRNRQRRPQSPQADPGRAPPPRLHSPRRPRCYDSSPSRARPAARRAHPGVAGAARTAPHRAVPTADHRPRPRRSAPSRCGARATSTARCRSHPPCSTCSTATSRTAGPPTCRPTSGAQSRELLLRRRPPTPTRWAARRAAAGSRNSSSGCRTTPPTCSTPATCRCTPTATPSAPSPTLATAVPSPAPCSATPRVAPHRPLRPRHTNTRHGLQRSQDDSGWSNHRSRGASDCSTVFPNTSNLNAVAGVESRSTRPADKPLPVDGDGDGSTRCDIGAIERQRSDSTYHPSSGPWSVGRPGRSVGLP